MNPMIPGLNNDKMSSSDEHSKIDLIETPKKILAKIKSAFFDPKSCETSPIMLFIKHVVFFISKTGKFLVKRSEEHGGDLEYSSYDDLLQACQAEKVHPADVKTALGEFLIELLEPVRQNLNTPEFKAITQAVYSPKVENSKPKSNLVSLELHHS